MRQYFSLYRTVPHRKGERGKIFWLVGCFGFNGPLRQYFSLYRAVSQREGRKRRERIDESTNVQTTPTRTYCKCSRPLPYCNPNRRTPRHWKFTQHHRTTRPPRKRKERTKESKNVQITPTRTYCKRNRALHYYIPKRRTPRHCLIGWLILGLTAL